MINDVKRVINTILQEDVNADEISKFEDLGFSSMSFIAFIVELEEEYDIEFEDDYLDMKKYDSLDEFCMYLKGLIDKKRMYV